MNKIRIMNFEPKGFNEQEAMDFVSSYFDPITSFLMWAVIPMAIIATIGISIRYFQKEEDERDLNRYRKSLTVILIIAIVSQSIVTLFRIFGM